MTIWVLLSEHNDYDQHGAYFIHAWDHRPSLQELMDHGVEASRFGKPAYTYFVQMGGGRIEFGDYYENQWYTLQEVT